VIGSAGPYLVFTGAVYASRTEAGKAGQGLRKWSHLLLPQRERLFIMSPQAPLFDVIGADGGRPSGAICRSRVTGDVGQFLSRLKIGGLMLARIFMILAALFLLPNAAGATEAYHFIADVIRSLESSQIAGERIGSGDSYDILAHMRDIHIFNKYIKRADRIIKPYTKSNDELIKGSANLYDTIYLSIIENIIFPLTGEENEALNNPDVIVETFVLTVSIFEFFAISSTGVNCETSIKL